MGPETPPGYPFLQKTARVWTRVRFFDKIVLSKIIILTLFV